MPTIHHHLTHAKHRLKDAAIESYALDAELLLAHALQVTRERVIGYPLQEITKEQLVIFNSYIDRRSKREPLSHIIARREFWGRDFLVTSDTLDPRPDSETLIEAVLATIPTDRPCHILDCGTGTGCLIITLLAERPQATGVGLDVSEKALAIAQQNAKALGVEARLTFLHQSWEAPIEGVFDLIISNPPYIPTHDIITLAPEVREYEPHLALDGGGDGLVCYRSLLPRAGSLVKKEGAVWIEFGQGQEGDIEVIARAAGFTHVETRKDLAGIVRCMGLRYL